MSWIIEAQQSTGRGPDDWAPWPTGNKPPRSRATCDSEVDTARAAYPTLMFRLRNVQTDEIVNVPPRSARR